MRVDQSLYHQENNEKILKLQVQIQITGIFQLCLLYSNNN